MAGGHFDGRTRRPERPYMRAFQMVHTSAARQHPSAAAASGRLHWTRRLLVAGLAWLACLSPAQAEDGYALWLRYQAVEPQAATAYRGRLTQLVAPDATPVQRAARAELLRGLAGLL